MRVRTLKFGEMKQAGERIPCLTAYDYPTARLADASGVPLILVGDSLANVVLGYESTVPVTMDEMLHHTKAVVRGSENALIASDMPFMSYQISPEEALRNAGRLLQEAGAQAVKLEGGAAIAPTVKRLVDAGIPVIGHLGLTPQSVHQLGGYRVQGRSLSGARKLVHDAELLEEAGAFAVVLETVPAEVGKVVTERLGVPTIGIGAGAHCDGEIQVLHEILGLIDGRPRKHAKLYADLNAVISDALSRYVTEVRGGTFPGDEQSFSLDDGVLRDLLGGLGSREWSS
jgi:3-methyl-2-oxobutanoate hydroxymethyltransferase